MARIVLFVIAAVGLGTLAVGLGAGDRAHTESQQRALVRETLDDAVAMMLDRSIHEGRRGWNTRSPYRDPFEVNGYTVEVEAYDLEDDGQVVVFTLLARVGGAVVRQTSRYRLADPNWPGPLWFDTPLAVAKVSPRAKIDGSSRSATHGALFNSSRFHDYNLGSVLDLDEITRSLGDSIDVARGTRAALEVHRDEASIKARYDSPTPTEVIGTALSEFDPTSDVRFSGPTVVLDDRRWGAFAARGDALIVHVQGDLTIGPTGDVRGGGILIVEGDFRVQGTLRWGGLVIVRSQEQTLDIDFDLGDVQIRGSLVVDHAAPPPGGHTDLTVNRSVDGSWSHGYGEPTRESYGWRPWFRHTHRIDHVIPEERRFYFAERGRDRHESYVRFRESLTDIASANPGDEVYIRFKNHTRHGAALYHLVAGGETYSGAVINGLGRMARPGDSWASPSFLPAELDTLVLDVQSLRMLQHLTNGETPTSPLWTGGACDDRPQCVGLLEDRDGALAVQIVRSLDDRPLYEASVYWHSKEPGHVQYEQEQAADEAWRRAIQAGVVDYGTDFRAGDDTDILFDNGQVARVLNRLGFNQLRLVHMGSFVEDVSDLTPTGPPASGPRAPLTHPNPSGPSAPDPSALGPSPPDPRAPASSLPAGCQSPMQLMKVCRPPSGGDTSWNDVEVTCLSAVAWIASGALPGTCSDNRR